MHTDTQPEGRAAAWPEIRSEVPFDFPSEECPRLSALIRRLCFAEDSPSMNLRADVSRAGYREAWLWSWVCGRDMQASVALLLTFQSVATEREGT